MPQSSAALRLRAEALRLLRNPTALQGSIPLSRTVWAKNPFTCAHGACVALEVRGDGLWVLVRDEHGEAFAPVARVLNPEQRRQWARGGFG